MSQVTSILLVDDEEASNFLTGLLLEELGVAQRIDKAINGQQALEYLEACGESNPCPELILLDINMPVMDGFEVMDHLRRMPLAKPVRIVLLTSSVSPRDAQKAQGYGVELINKPVTLQKLKALF